MRLRVAQFSTPLARWILLAILSGSALGAVRHWIHRIRAEERARIFAAADSAHHRTADSLRLVYTKALDSASRAVQRQDTVIRWRVREVRHAVAALPDSLRHVPEVQRLEAHTLALADESERLRMMAVRLVETSAVVVRIDSTMIRGLRLSLVQSQIRIAELERRPSRAKAVLWSVGSGIVGIATGVLLRNP